MNVYVHGNLTLLLGIACQVSTLTALLSTSTYVVVLHLYALCVTSLAVRVNCHLSQLLTLALVHHMH